MTTITLEVPDDLAVRLARRQEQLPELLSIAVDLFPAEMPLTTLAKSEIVHPAMKDVIDFLLSRPTPAQIITFKVSPTTQARLEELLDKNRENLLTDDEAAELDTYQQINHLLILLKAHARSALSSGV